MLFLDTKTSKSIDKVTYFTGIYILLPLVKKNDFQHSFRL